MSYVARSTDAEATPDRVLWGRAVSWGLYDFANTIYSALVVSFAITLHVKEFTGVERWTFLTTGLSLAASGVFLPVAGEMADRAGGARRSLLVLTVVACLSCGLIGRTDSAWVMLGLFFVANFCFHSSLVFYDSLMPTLAPKRRLGMISGLGVALGYIGVAFALPVGWLVIEAYQHVDPQHELRLIFPLAGLLFLLFSVPLFVFVPEKAPTKKGAPGNVARLAFRRVLTTLRLLPRHRAVLLFLLGNFFLVDTLNTGIIAVSPYMVHVFGLEKQTAMLWLIPFSLGAGILGALAGWIADAAGPRRTMLGAGLCVGVSVVVGAFAPHFAVFMPVFVLVGGFGLAGIWVAGRKLLVQIVPDGQVGKYFGLYNVGHKLSMFGAVAFGLLADLEIPGVHAGGYRLGLLAQLLFLTVGLVCIYKVGADGD